MENLDLHQTISRLRFALERASNQLLVDECGWGSSHFRLLVCIAHAQNADQAEIARELGQTEAAVSRQLKFLIDNKLIMQKANPENRRQNQLSITPFGHQELVKAKALMKKNLNRLFADLDPGTMQQTINLLESITAKIELVNKLKGQGDKNE